MVSSVVSSVVSSEAVVLIFAVMAVFLIVMILVLSYILRMKGDPTPAQTVYECGEEPFGSAIAQFNSRYYVFALIYVIFAVEAIFTIPWAVSLTHASNKPLILIEMFLFIGVLVVGLGYAWKKGALEW